MPVGGENVGIAHQLQRMAADPGRRDASNAARATSGPMPAGSPMVMRMGAVPQAHRYLADFDIGSSRFEGRAYSGAPGRKSAGRTAFFLDLSWRVGIT